LKADDEAGFGMAVEYVIYRMFIFFQGIVIPSYKILNANKEDCQ